MKILNFVKFKGLQIYSDSLNICKYGKFAPRYAELMFFDPIREMPVFGGGARYGEVSAEPFSSCKERVADITPVKEVLQHFEYGVSWEETGLYKRMEEQLKVKGYVDGCRNMHDVFERYKALDRLYEETRFVGRFKTQQELNTLSIREFGGITLHVNSDGELIFSKIGQHRLAIALALNLKNVPFSVGCVSIIVARNFSEIRTRFAPS